ncbi:serine/arginine-rich splicing factor 2 [Elysia marginata]|uniref:Serine/arginine-rich splicing factor 2 n=1 Tax=Elysia marginata TaxID=1093978 RepID=A0AAV4I366_9GAST|nr:serine/arginine-rich splicing factor 2 [Elysia marginata]
MSGYGNRGPPDIEGMVSLKVDNLTYRTTPDDLRRAFEKYGDVGDVYIPRDRFTRESRGFAFVRFFVRDEAEDAMDKLDGTLIDGRQVRCQMARYGRPSESHGRRDRGPPRRGHGGSSRRRSRSRSRSPRRRSRRSRSYSSHSRSRSRSRSRSSRGRQASRSRSRSYEQNGAEASD